MIKHLYELLRSHNITEGFKTIGRTTVVQRSGVLLLTSRSPVFPVEVVFLNIISWCKAKN